MGKNKTCWSQATSEKGKRDTQREIKDQKESQPTSGFNLPHPCTLGAKGGIFSIMCPITNNALVADWWDCVVQVFFVCFPRYKDSVCKNRGLFGSFNTKRTASGPRGDISWIWQKVHWVRKSLTPPLSLFHYSNLIMWHFQLVAKARVSCFCSHCSPAALGVSSWNQTIKYSSGGDAKSKRRLLSGGRNAADKHPVAHRRGL